MFGRTETPPLFEATVLRHVDSLYRFAHYLTGNGTEAEDLTQHTCLLAFRNFHRFRQGTDPKAWLFTIARNANIDRMRRKNREPVVADLSQAAGQSRGPDEQGESRLLSARGQPIESEEVFFDLFGDEVNRYLSELPSSFRLALVLCDVEGFSYQEISEIMACPLGTVRSRISRARDYLREKLHEYARDLGFVKESTE